MLQKKTTAAKKFHPAFISILITGLTLPALIERREEGGRGQTKKTGLLLLDAVREGSGHGELGT